MSRGRPDGSGSAGQSGIAIMRHVSKALGALALTVVLSSSALAVEGLVTVPSGFPVRQTIERLEAALKGGGATIFARVDHAAGAAAANLSLRPTELLIFGNPKGGTPLMQQQQAIGIDLPLKVLAWEDQAGKVWVSYNDPVWLVARHGATADASKVAEALLAGLKGAVGKATTGP